MADPSKVLLADGANPRTRGLELRQDSTGEDPPAMTFRRELIRLVLRLADVLDLGRRDLVPSQHSGARRTRLSIEPLETRELLSINALGAEFCVNSLTLNSQATREDSPGAVAMDSQGNFVVTWTSTGGQDGDAKGVFGQRLVLMPGSTSVLLDDANNLVITDTGFVDPNNQLTIQSDVTNGVYVITDSIHVLGTNIVGASGGGSHTVTVPFSAVSGPQILVRTFEGNDELTIDYSLGNFSKQVDFDGGNQTTSDSLALTGGSFASVVHSFSGPSSGNVSITGNSLVSYTGLEPIVDTLSAVDRIFNLPSGPASDATLADDGVAANGLSRLSAPTFELVDFSNPSGLVTINRGTASDSLTVGNLPDFSAGLTIGSAANPLGTITLAGNLTLGPDKSLTASATGNLSLPDAASQVRAGGAIALSTLQSVYLGSGASLTTISGDLTLQANLQDPPSLGNFTGIDIDGARVSSTTGNITLTGRSGDDTYGWHYGVDVRGGGRVGEDATGHVTVTGMGGTQSSIFNYGVHVTGANSEITSGGGNVTVTGTGGGAIDSLYGMGVNMSAGGKVSAGGNGSVNVTGFGGRGAGGLTGVHLTGVGTQISSSGGNIAVTGAGAHSALDSGNSEGVRVQNSATITAGGAGSVTIVGSGGNGNLGLGHGVVVSGASSRIGAAAGSVAVTGYGGASTNNRNYGVLVQNGGRIDSVSGAELLVVGQGGTGISQQIGVIVSGASAQITAGGGNVTIIGNGGVTGTDMFIEASPGVLVSDGGKVTASGNVSVLGAGSLSNGPFGGHHGVMVSGPTSSIATTAGSVSITGVGGGNLSSTQSNAGVWLAGNATISVSGSGAVNITGSGGVGTANNYGIRLSGNGSIASDGGNLTIAGTAGTGSNSFAVSIDSGGRALTTSGTPVVSVIADSFELVASASINAGNGAVLLRPRTAGTWINLGAADVLTGNPLTLGIADTELDQITAGSIQIGNAASGNIAVSSAINTPGAGMGADLSLITGGNATFSGSVTMATDKSLAVNALNTITMGSVVQSSGAGNLSLESARNINVNSSGNLTSVNGDLRLAANQQAIPTDGVLIRVSIFGLVQSTGAGSVTVLGKSGSIGGFAAIRLGAGGVIKGGATGPVSVQGQSPGLGNGVMLFGAGATITSNGAAVNVSGVGGGTLSSKGHGVVVLDGTITSGGGGNVTVQGTGSPLATANAHGVFVQGSSSVITSGGGQVQVTGIAGVGGVAVFQGASSTISSTGSGNITLVGDSMTLGGVVNAGVNQVTLQPRTAGVGISVLGGGDPASGPLNIDQSEFNTITASTIQIGNATSGTILVSGNLTRASNFALVSGGNIAFTLGSINTGGGNLSLTAGGSVQPIRSGTDVTTSSNSTLSFGPETDLLFILNGPAADSQYDQLKLAGKLDLTGVGLILAGLYVPAVGDVFTLIDNDGSEPTVGEFNGLPQGTIVNVNGVAREITYTANDGNDVALVVPTLRVVSLTPTSTGFVAEFNWLIDPSELNLFDPLGMLGDADLIVGNATVGPPRGSVVVDPGLKKITFIKSGDPLAPGTYPVTLVSGTSAFKSATGSLLDGNNDGVAGGNFTGNITIATRATNTVTLGIPDFTRGYGQAVHVPSSPDGLPISISDAQGVKSVSFELRYDPALLTISGAAAGAGIMGSVSLDTSVPGVAQITVTSGGQLSASAGRQTLVKLTASVPLTAAYAEKHVLDLMNLQILDSSFVALPVRDDDGIHIAAYFGDANGSQTYNTPDATFTQRIIVGLDTGLAAYQLADPNLVVEISGNGQLQSNDVTLIQQAIVGIANAEIPPWPGMSPIVDGGPDPIISIPQNLVASVGETTRVPVQLLVTEPSGVTLAGVDLAIAYDASRLELDDVQLGQFLVGFGLSVNLSTPGLIKLSLAASSPLDLAFADAGILAELDFRVLDGSGPTRINLLSSDDALHTALYDELGRAMVLDPAPTNWDDDWVDGLLTIGDRWPEA